jgi:hypothetical protein
MNVEVTVRNKKFTLKCGCGAQKVRWLAEAAAHRYDPNYLMLVGQPKSIKFESGGVIGFNEIISEQVHSGNKLFVLFEEDF